MAGIPPISIRRGAIMARPLEKKFSVVIMTGVLSGGRGYP